jgi:hypothetical protein
MVARPPLASQLDIIKFICKDLFLFVYSKQIDNLRTNHRVRSRCTRKDSGIGRSELSFMTSRTHAHVQGVFVLQSHAFPPLTSLSSHRGPAADLEAAKAVRFYLSCKSDTGGWLTR